VNDKNFVTRKLFVMSVQWPATKDSTVSCVFCWQSIWYIYINNEISHSLSQIRNNQRTVFIAVIFVNK